jgi:AbrB family looped-hinge helix DNA binding protein
LELVVEKVTISSKGQVVIPKSLRESHHIQAGDQFIVSAVGDELRFRPAPTIDRVDLKSVAGMLRRASTEKLGDAEIEKRIGAQLLAADDATKPK